MIRKVCNKGICKQTSAFSDLYCAGNPINATDPTGMAVIFDQDGNFLDESIEGFTGEILIYKGDPITLDDGTTLDFRDGNGYSFSDFSETFLREHLLAYNEGNLSISAQVSIWNSVIGHFEGMQVYDETFSMDRIAGGKIIYLNELEYSDASWGTHFISNDGSYLEKPLIGGTGLFDSYEATVENFASSIIVHEFYSHGLKHNSDALKSHRLAYKNVINFGSLWNKITDRYKQFIMKMLMKFIHIETGRENMDSKYKELYEKYGK